MGQLVNLKCEKCGYETNLGLGAGMRYNDPEVALSFFDKTTREKIQAAIQSDGSIWSVYKEIGICDRCGKISAIAVLTVTDAAGKELVFKAKCSCGGEVDLADYESVLDGKSSITCPVCGDVLKATAEGFWD